MNRERLEHPRLAVAYSVLRLFTSHNIGVLLVFQKVLRRMALGRCEQPSHKGIRGAHLQSLGGDDPRLQQHRKGRGRIGDRRRWGADVSQNVERGIYRRADHHAPEAAEHGLHPILKNLEHEQGGLNIFRRFRITELKKAECPPALEHFWSGHARTHVSERYTNCCNSVSIGFSGPRRSEWVSSLRNAQLAYMAY
jgi:hypothetical protein